MKHIDEAIWQRLQDDRLVDDEMLALMEHLDQCPDCQARYLVTITPRFEELAELLIPDDFTTRTMELIQQHSPLPALSTAPSPSRMMAKSRLTPARLFKQRLLAYAVAASLTMILVFGGAFAQLTSLPFLRVEAPPVALEPNNSIFANLDAQAPLLPQGSVLPAARQPINLPPLRLLVERSNINDTKK